jgi:hypothetical protein
VTASASRNLGAAEAGGAVDGDNAISCPAANEMIREPGMLALA